MPKTTTQNTAIEKRPDNSATVNVPDRARSAEPQAQAPQTWYTPLVDVLETAEAFVFQADLPGVKGGDVDVTFENGTLTIEGRVQPRQRAGQSYVWREYGVGHFYRSFNIETPVNADGIKAELKSGVLELYVPKAETAKAKKIEIRSA